MWKAPNFVVCFFFVFRDFYAMDFCFFLHLPMMSDFLSFCKLTRARAILYSIWAGSGQHFSFQFLCNTFWHLENFFWQLHESLLFWFVCQLWTPICFRCFVLLFLASFWCPFNFIFFQDLISFFALSSYSRHQMDVGFLRYWFCILYNEKRKGLFHFNLFVHHFSSFHTFNFQSFS